VNFIKTAKIFNLNQNLQKVVLSTIFKMFKHCFAEILGESNPMWAAQCLASNCGDKLCEATAVYIHDWGGWHHHVAPPVHSRMMCLHHYYRATVDVKPEGDNCSDVLPLKVARLDSISNLTSFWASNLSCRRTQCRFI